MIDSYNMFQVPLWRTNVENWEQKKSQLLELLDEDNLDKNNNECVPNDYTSQQKDGRFYCRYCDQVSTILYDEISQFFQYAEIGGHMYAAWFERAGRSEYHHPHNHGMHGFSAVCFVEYDSEVHTPTQFTSPFTNFVTGEIINHSPPDIVESSLIFFPSSITHFTHSNLSDIPRTILSFNLNVTHF